MKAGYWHGGIPPRGPSDSGQASRRSAEGNEPRIALRALARSPAERLPRCRCPRAAPCIRVARPDWPFDFVEVILQSHQRALSLTPPPVGRPAGETKTNGIRSAMIQPPGLQQFAALRRQVSSDCSLRTPGRAAFSPLRDVEKKIKVI